MRIKGRTTRMLAYATQLEKQGKEVYIVAANKKHADYLRKKLSEKTTIKVGTEHSLGYFKWSIVKLMEASPDAIVLVDHFTIEHKFHKMLEELHRYDG